MISRDHIFRRLGRAAERLKLLWLGGSRSLGSISIS